MKSDLVSIIVPIYNVEQYLRQCIESLITQTYCNIEIILVDDESPDNSPIICDEYANQDDRIKVIHKVNGGVSSARNVGIECAHGEWITFVDGDDYLEEFIIEKAMKTLKNSDCAEKDVPLVQWNYSILKKGKIEKQSNLYIKNMNKELLYAFAIGSIFTNQEVQLKGLGCPWGKLFSSTVLKKNEIRFDEKIYMAEDRLFVWQYLKYLTNLIVVNENGYLYRIHSESACGRYKEDFFEQVSASIKAFLLLRDEIQDSNQIKVYICIQDFIWRSYVEVLRNSRRGIVTGKLERTKKFDDAKKVYRLYIAEISCEELFRKNSIKNIRLWIFLNKKIPVELHMRLAYAYVAWKEF